MPDDLPRDPALEPASTAPRREPLRSLPFVAPALAAVLLLAGCPTAGLDPSDDDDAATPDDDDSAPNDDDSADDDDDSALDDDDDATEPPPPPPLLLINEFVAAGAPDAIPAGDWIELHNPGDEPVSLEGFSLRDAPVDGEPFPLDPSLSVPAGGHLVLLADGEPDLGPTHLGLRLSVDGDRLQLLYGDAVVQDLDFGELLQGWSLARNGDSSHDWEVRSEPSPGAANPLGEPVLPPADDPQPCLPRDEDPVSILEGEQFVVQLFCDGGALDEHDLVVHSTGAPGAWDAAAATWTLDTDLDDAGRHEVLFALKPQGAGGLPETERAAVNVVDAWGVPGNLPVDPATYLQEWGLPVLHLDPQGGLSQSYTATDAWFEGVAYSAQMKVRGASSVGYPKNSFTVEFDPVQIDLRDHGMSRKDHLVLISNFDDAAYVRQKMVFDVWQEMADFRGADRLTPRTAWVVLYLDGVYFGLYTAADHIDDEFVGELDFVDTGNLYKSVSHDANFYLHHNDGSPKSNLAAGWEKKEGPAEDWSDLTGLTQWAGTIDSTQFAAEAGAWIDVQEFSDWFLLVMHLLAGDSAAKNAYLYNDPAGTGMRYVPWDFNHSLGQNWRTLRVDPSDYSDYSDRNAIFAHLHADPGLAQELWDHYELLRAPGAPLSALRLQELAAEHFGLIHPSAVRDWARWGDEHRNYSGWSSLRGGPSAIGGYAEERAYLEQWIDTREMEMMSLFPAPAP